MLAEQAGTYATPDWTEQRRIQTAAANRA